MLVMPSLGCVATGLCKLRNRRIEVANVTRTHKNPSETTIHFLKCLDSVFDFPSLLLFEIEEEHEKKSKLQNRSLNPRHPRISSAWGIFLEAVNIIDLMYTRASRVNPRHNMDQKSLFTSIKQDTISK